MNPDPEVLGYPIDKGDKRRLAGRYGKKCYRSAFSQPELEPILVGKDSILFPTGALPKEEPNEFMYGQWVNKDDILPRKTYTKQNLTKFVLHDRLSKAWGLDNMRVAPGEVELNNTTKYHPRRFTFGVVESVKHVHQDHADE
jgi:hypothetical protein